MRVFGRLWRSLVRLKVPAALMLWAAAGGCVTDPVFRSYSVRKGGEVTYSNTRTGTTIVVKGPVKVQAEGADLYETEGNDDEAE